MSTTCNSADIPSVTSILVGTPRTNRNRIHPGTLRLNTMVINTANLIMMKPITHRR